ncbi:MAG: RNA-directed DNA polymerase [Acidobacteriota bacterium]|nr:RNA-directed DNA polymerase [Acidobacteriota bacterium]
MPTQVTTGRGLSPAAAFTGLVDHGLFSEKLPTCFTSEGLSACLPPALLPVTTEVNPKKLRKLLADKTHNYMRYSLLRDSNVPRQLGVPHPESYLAQCLAIQRLFPTIKRHCSKPHPPVSRIFVRRTAGKRVFQMNYQGQERFDNTELDLQHMTGAAYVAHTDISSCFPSIYTHSIPWALHGKATAKQGRFAFSAGNLLDRATQCTQDGQTNGLLIGPHSSNLLAEIILTSVDEKILKRGYSRVVRHIDDYRFYAKTHEEAERFLRELSLELRKFELVLNDRKTRILRMPRPLANEWVRQLNGSRLARGKGRVGIGPPRSLLDLALKLAQENGTSAVLNYAIKMVPARLYPRARPLFVRQVVNLALQYPYLATLLDVHLFQKHRYDGIETIVREFSDELVVIGTRRLFSGAMVEIRVRGLR